MPRPDEFVSPRPYTTVLWRHTQDAEPSPALVTAIFERTVSCTVFPIDSPRGMPKDGVRHISDPIAPHIDPAEGGGYWDFTEDQVLLRHVTGEDSSPTPKKS